MADDEHLEFDVTFNPFETEVLLTIHRVAEEIAERMGKTPHPDPWRTLLAIGNAWLARVQDEGGPEAMARALTILEAQDREQAGKQAH